MKITTLILVCSTLGVSAADVCVRVGAGGSNNGTDWNNAYTTLPSSTLLSRGDTVYVADGDYLSDFVLQKPPSGSTFITIKKATVSSHGPATGWLDSYGDGQANIPHFIIGSSSGTSAGWFDVDFRSSHVTGGYGVRIDGGADNACISVMYGMEEYRSVYLRGFHLDGPLGSGDGVQDFAVGIDMVESSGTGTVWPQYHDFLIANNRLRGFATALFIAAHTGAGVITMEYNSFEDGRQVGPDHQNVVYGQFDKGIFRYNRVFNWNVEGVMVCGFGTSTWKIHGNVFYKPDDGGTSSSDRGVEFHGNYGPYVDNEVYNNTFHGDFGSGAVRAQSGASHSNTRIQNNLLVGSAGIQNEVGGGLVVNNNISTNTSVFVDVNNNDYHIKYHLPGTSLAAEFNTDPDGSTRTTWDVGAYENGSAAFPPVITSITDILGTNGIAFSYSIVVSNGATSYGATNLPAGLSVNSVSGIISGTPSATVTNSIGLFATNASGFDFEVNTLSILPPTPVMSVTPSSLTYNFIATNTTGDITFTVTNIVPGTTLAGWVTNITPPFDVVQTGDNRKFSLTDGQSTNFTLRYSPTSVGQNSGTVTFVGGNGSSNTLVGAAFPMSGTTNWTMTNSLVILPMLKNVAGNYVSSTNQTDEPDTGGIATFGWSASSAGTIKLLALANAPSGSDNSFFAYVNPPGTALASPSAGIVWDVIETPSAFTPIVGVHKRGNGTFDTPESLTNAFPVVVGVNQITIMSREANTQLRTLLIQFTADAPSDPLRVATGLRVIAGSVVVHKP